MSGLKISQADAVDRDGELTESAVQLVFARVAELPPAAVGAVFRRYGRPLEVKMPPPEADDLRATVTDLSQGAGVATVRLLQTLGFGDVIPNDYFVLEGADETPLAVPGPLFAGALEALARAARIA